MSEKSDEGLVTRLRAGDAEAFEQIYRRYKGDVLALVAGMLGRGDGAWDVLHDVFVSLARCAPRLAPATNVRAYLLTAAANRARNRLRRQRNENGGPDPFRETSGPTARDPAAIVAGEEEVKRLWDAVAALPEDQRVVVTMRVYGDMTFKEVGEVEGVSENTARSRYRYALDRLRRRLAGVA